VLQFVVQIISVKGNARSAEVAIVVYVPHQPTVDQREHTEASYVKLSMHVQSWIFDILLDYKGTVLVKI
jgi:hypothetical protein